MKINDEKRKNKLKKFYLPNNPVYYDDPSDDLQYKNFKLHNHNGNFFVSEADGINNIKPYKYNFIYLDIQRNKTATNFINKKNKNIKRALTNKAAKFIMHTFLLKKLKENNIPLQETKYNYRYKIKYCPWAMLCELYELDAKHAIIRMGYAKTFTFYWKYFRDNYEFLKPLLEKELWARQLLISFLTKFGKLDKLNTKKYKWILEKTEYFYIYHIRKEKHINNEKLLDKCKGLFPYAENNSEKVAQKYHDGNGRVRIKFGLKLYRGMKVKTTDILNLHIGKPCQLDFRFPLISLLELCLTFNNPSSNIVLTYPISGIIDGGQKDYKIEGDILKRTKRRYNYGLIIDVDLNIKCNFKLLKKLNKHVEYITLTKQSFNMVKTVIYPWIEEYLKTINNNRKLVWRKKAANNFKIKYYEQSFSKL